jgi:hypothetical protein
MKQITDEIGTYDIPTNQYDFDNANAIYLNVFHNEGQINSNEWKVCLNVYYENGNRETFTAGIINKFEPARWLRSIPQDYREFAFYRDFLEWRNQAKKLEVKWDKKASAGFFYSNSLGHDSPFNTAYAYIVKQEEQDPIVGIRFWDYTYFGQVPVNKFLKGKGPKWTLVLKEPKKKGMIDGWG